MVNDRESRIPLTVCPLVVIWIPLAVAVWPLRSGGSSLRSGVAFFFPGFCGLGDRLWPHLHSVCLGWAIIRRPVQLGDTQPGEMLSQAEDFLMNYTRLKMFRKGNILTIHL